MELYHVLRLPDKMAGPSRVAWTGLDGLLVVPRRLSYPGRLPVMSKEFGRSPPDLSRIFNVTLVWLWNQWGGLLQDPFTRQYFSPALLASYEHAIRAKSGVNLRIWGFIYGTVMAICKPGVNQRMFYNGHKRFHGLNFQGVSTPDGLITHLYGPVVGSRHDSGVLGESGLLAQLEQHMQVPGGEYFALYGDPAYPRSRYIQKGYVGGAITPQQ